MNASGSPVFLILAHSDSVMFKKLTGRLIDVGHVVAHIDRKADASDFFMPDVDFVSKRHSVNWAGFSMVAATIELIQEALRKYPDASHYVLLSGADYPLVSNKKLTQFFTDTKGWNHIKFINIKDGPAHYRKMLKRWCFRDLLGTRGAPVVCIVIRKVLELLMRAVPKKFPSDLTPCYGSSWWALTPECAIYIMKEISVRKFWLKYWHFVASPDEQFFHTIVANSPFLEKSDGFVRIKERGLWQLQNLHYVHPSLSKVYTVDDWEDIKATHGLFLRKLDSKISAALIDKLDGLNEDIIDKDRCGITDEHNS